MKHLKKGSIFLIALSLSSVLLTGCNSSESKQQSDNISNNQKKLVQDTKKDNLKNIKEIHKKEDEKQLDIEKTTNLSTPKKHTIENSNEISKKDFLNNKPIIHVKNKKTVSNKLHENKIIASKKSSETNYDVHNEVKKDNKINDVDAKSSDINTIKESIKVKSVDSKSNGDNKIKKAHNINNIDDKSNDDNESKDANNINNVDNKSNDDNESKDDNKVTNADNKSNDDNDVKADNKVNTVDTKSNDDSDVKTDNKVNNVDTNSSDDNDIKDDNKVNTVDTNLIENNKSKDDDKVNNIELVNIKDANLRKAINKALGRDVNSLDNITAHDMETITKIDSGFLALSPDEKGTPKRGIKSLSGLEYAKNLKTLKVSMNSINDLTPIKDLTNLEFLEVFRNEISDLTPLRNLKNLEHLDIYNNTGIVDVEPISKLEKIKFIDMHYCNRRTAKVNYEYLGNLTNLEYLSIDDDFVDDVSFVKNLKKLNTFSCNNNYVTNLTDIQDLAADSFEDWSGDKFFNMYGQMLKEDIKVQAPSEGTVYKMKCPVTGADKYIKKIYKTYEITEGLPAITILSENDNISLNYNKFTNELELTVGKNTSPNKTNTKFTAVLEYGMYSLKMTFDITQDGAKDISKA